ncbi:MAG: hypothetical protein U5J96_04495 [Ignavibacteriaceae bacterium]|nr:hypothetical protein [Ignavibacteriaceae bacterium]
MNFALFHALKMDFVSRPHFNEKGYRFVELIGDNCTGCPNCALVCPEAAITVYRQPKPAKKVAASE